MSKSQIEELFGFLALLTATQLTGWWRGFFFGYGIANLIVAAYLATRN